MLKKTTNKLFMSILIVAVILCSLFISSTDHVIATTAQAATTSSVKLTKSTIMMVRGKTYTLALRGTTKKPKWSSSKKAVATVNSKGKVTAKKSGTTIVKAKIGKKTYKCKVTVKSAKLNMNKKTMNVGDTATLKVTGAKVTKWISSDTAVAAVSPSGKITAKKAGIATVKATVGVNNLTCKVTVKATAHTHTYVAKITKEATCASTGVKTYTCSICGNTYTETIAKRAHAPVIDPAVAATCTSAGKSDGSHCSVCGKTIKDQTVIKSTGHSYNDGVVIQKPTCTKIGHKTVTCTKCGETTTVSIPRINHTAVIDKAVAPTCTSVGKTEGSHCSVCGEVIKNQENVNPTEHSYDSGIITKAATCTATGVKTYTCKSCGATKTETIPVTDHCWDNGTDSQIYVIDQEAYTSEELVERKPYLMCTGCDKRYYIEDYNNDQAEAADAVGDHLMNVYHPDGASYTLKYEGVWKDVYHEAVGHYETVKTYTCTICGATK